MTGYRAMDRDLKLFRGNKKGHIREGMRPKQSSYAASLRWYYPGQV